MSNKRRYNIDFSQQTFKMLRELAEEKNVSMSSIIRESIENTWFVRSLLKNKNQRLILIDETGKEREIVLWN